MLENSSLESLSWNLNTLAESVLKAKLFKEIVSKNSDDK